MLWSDNMVIPVGAPNPTAAEAWMNYVYDPKNQAQITEYNNYVSPVSGVKPILQKTDPTAAKSHAHLPERAIHRQVRRRAPAERRGGDEGDRRVQRGGQRLELSQAAARGLEDGDWRRRLTPYLLLVPGLLLARRLLRRARCTTWRGSRSTSGLDREGLQFTWQWSNYTRRAHALRRRQFIRSFEYAGAATIICPADRLPARLRDRLQGRQVEERDAVRGRRAVLHHLPDPHLAWQTILADQSPVVNALSAIGARRRAATSSRRPAR